MAVQLDFLLIAIEWEMNSKLKFFLNPLENPLPSFRLVKKSELPVLDDDELWGEKLSQHSDRLQQIFSVLASGDNHVWKHALISAILPFNYVKLDCLILTFKVLFVVVELIF